MERGCSQDAACIQLSNSWLGVPTGKCEAHSARGQPIDKYVYGKLPPGVLEELKKKNPVTQSGYRKNKFYQFLTGETGIPHLDKQLAAVTMPMRISDDSKDFEDNFQKAFEPAQPHQQSLPLVIDTTPTKSPEDTTYITNGAKKQLGEHKSTAGTKRYSRSRKRDFLAACPLRSRHQISNASLGHFPAIALVVRPG
jgi:hypothetical protein